MRSTTRSTLLLTPCLAMLPYVQADEHAGHDHAAEEKAKGMTQEELEAVSLEIRADIEVLRGADFSRPVTVKVATAEELREYMQRRIEKTTEPGELGRQESVAKLLGLVPADMDLEASLYELIDSQAGGFYDPDEEAFYLMAQFANTGVTRTIIAHELTHALDDQLYSIDGIGATLSDNGDAELAFHSVVEGSGTAVMERWSVEAVRSGELSMGEMMESGDMGLDALATMPEYLWKPLLASYLVGKTFLSRTTSLMAAGLKPAKMEDIDAAFKSPPLSTEQVLHPEKYWDSEQRDDPRAVALDGSELPGGWEITHEDTLGELGLAMIATPRADRSRIDPKNPLGIMGLEYTNDAAAGWDGDRYLLLEKDGAEILYCATVWDSSEELAEFTRTMLEPEFLAERQKHLESLRADGESQGVGFEVLEGLELPGGDSVAFMAYRGVAAEEARAVAAAVRVAIGE